MYVSASLILYCCVAHCEQLHSTPLTLISRPVPHRNVCAHLCPLTLMSRPVPHRNVCAFLCPDADIDDYYDEDGTTCDVTPKVDPQVRLEAEVKCTQAHYVWKAEWIAQEKRDNELRQAAEMEEEARRAEIEKRRIQITGERELSEREQLQLSREDRTILLRKQEKFREAEEEELRIANKKKRRIKDEPEAESDEDDELRKINCNEDAPATRTRSKKKRRRNSDHAKRN